MENAGRSQPSLRAEPASSQLRGGRRLTTSSDATIVTFCLQDWSSSCIHFGGEISRKPLGKHVIRAGRRLRPGKACLRWSGGQAGCSVFSELSTRPQCAVLPAARGIIAVESALYWLPDRPAGDSRAARHGGVGYRERSGHFVRSEPGFCSISPISLVKAPSKGSHRVKAAQRLPMTSTGSFE